VFTQLAQETMKEISDLIGNKTIRKGSETKNHKLSSGGRTESTQISEEGQPLVISSYFPLLIFVIKYH
jgi:type IV secretory pathway TraG/TraD family ATPase VirD4